MKYFTKYLPVEGEIKEGDWYWQAGKGYAQATKDGVLYKAYTGDKPVKLFLCSRDIQVGDELLHLSSNEKFIVDNLNLDSSGDSWTEWNGMPCFIYNPTIKQDYSVKVIGEISPDALGYVKEGQEFSDNEIMINCYQSLYKVEKELIEEITRLQKTVYIAVKGPCGHFH